MIYLSPSGFLNEKRSCRQWSRREVCVKRRVLGPDRGKAHTQPLWLSLRPVSVQLATTYLIAHTVIELTF
jgi:hypothetical protein